VLYAARTFLLHHKDASGRARTLFSTAKLNKIIKYSTEFHKKSQISSDLMVSSLSALIHTLRDRAKQPLELLFYEFVSLHWSFFMQ